MSVRIVQDLSQKKDSNYLCDLEILPDRKVEHEVLAWKVTALCGKGPCTNMALPGLYRLQSDVCGDCPCALQVPGPIAIAARSPSPCALVCLRDIVPPL